MEYLFAVDWQGAFVPDTPLLEIVLRGSIVYLAIFLMLRFVLRRESGTIGIGDLLVVVLLADAAQNAMAADYRSIPDGILLVAVIIGWNYALQRLAYHFPRFRAFVDPPPLPLIKNGQMLRRNMRRELITEDELRGQMRLQGVDDLSRVKAAYMESDGRISVISGEQQGSGTAEKKAA
jgi:uncharacterized membrane protein YcaP (DUF421 family)